MIDYHSSLVNALKTVLPTHYEMTLTAKTPTPCISYMEVNNYATAIGDTIGVSELSYQVKVWGHSIKDIQSYAIQIDNVLRPLGWRRISSGELYDPESTMIQKIMTYEATALETYNLGG